MRTLRQSGHEVSYHTTHHIPQYSLTVFPKPEDSRSANRSMQITDCRPHSLSWELALQICALYGQTNEHHPYPASSALFRRTAGCSNLRSLDHTPFIWQMHCSATLSPWVSHPNSVDTVRSSLPTSCPIPWFLSRVPNPPSPQRSPTLMSGHTSH